MARYFPDSCGLQRAGKISGIEEATGESHCSNGDWLMGLYYWPWPPPPFYGPSNNDGKRCVLLIWQFAPCCILYPVPCACKFCLLPCPFPIRPFRSHTFLHIRASQLSQPNLLSRRRIASIRTDRNTRTIQSAFRMINTARRVPETSMHSPDFAIVRRRYPIISPSSPSAGVALSKPLKDPQLASRSISGHPSTNHLNPTTQDGNMDTDARIPLAVLE